MRRSPRFPRKTGGDARGRLTLSLTLPLLLLCGCATPLPPPKTEKAWRIGPLVERARTEDGDSLLAIRPFFSHELAAADQREDFDLLWPFGIHRRANDRWRWRLLLAYGLGDSEGEEEEAYRFRVLPFYFSGRTREGQSYRALFPLYGEISDFLWLGDASFALFPLYGKSESHGTTTRTFLWPFYLTRHGERIDQLRLWPFYGKRSTTGFSAGTHSFALWPFWSHVRMDNASVSGSGYVLFPLYGSSRYESRSYGTERGFMLLPPLIGLTRSESGYRSLRAPWPFIRQLDDGARRERHWWPLYGTAEDTGSSRWYALWPIISRNRWHSEKHATASFNVMPFYYSQSFEPETSANEAGAGGTPVAERYRRLWPLFSWQRRGEATRLRIPELTLFHKNQAIERNWAPLWSLFVRQKRADGAYSTDILWGLASWGRDSRQRSFRQFLWIFNFRGAAPPAKGMEDDSS